MGLHEIEGSLSANYWIITPEKSDDSSCKKPELTVENVFNDHNAQPHMVMELKKNEPSVRSEKAPAQPVAEIKGTVEFLIHVFAVVQCGSKVGLFDYHNDQSNLDEENIPHFRGPSRWPTNTTTSA